MPIPVIAIRGGITLLSEVIQIISGIVMLVPKRKRSEINPDGIYNTTDAAKLLGTSRRTIIQFIRGGELTARRIGDRYHIPGKSLIVFLAQDIKNG